MNPQIKQKWVDALRSGDYQQGQCYLRTNSGFCCLGVLCDLYGKENNVEWQHNEVVGYFYENHSFSLPSSVLEWAGLEYCNPRVDDETNSLAGLNDKGSTFIEIANLIEEQL
jgi:hypothetical protein